MTNRLQDATPEQIEELRKKYMQYPWFEKTDRFLLRTQEITIINLVYELCQISGVLIDESTGQFTGNCWHQTWLCGDKEYEFMFEEDRLFELEVYMQKGSI